METGKVYSIIGCLKKIKDLMNVKYIYIYIYNIQITIKKVFHFFKKIILTNFL